MFTDALNGNAKIISDNDAGDAPNTADNDDGSTDSKTSLYVLRNCNHDPNASDYDAAYTNDAAPPDSLIDSKHNRNIFPRSMIKLKKIKT